MTIAMGIIGTILSTILIMLVISQFFEKSVQQITTNTLIVFFSSILLMRLWKKVLENQDELILNIVPSGNYQTGDFNNASYYFMAFIFLPLFFLLIKKLVNHILSRPN